MAKNAYTGLCYSQKSYYVIWLQTIILSASKEVVKKSKSDASAKLRVTEEPADVGVSVDDTWQRRFLVNTGVVTAISIDSGKVLDVAILSKSCKSFTSMKKSVSSDPARYDILKLAPTFNLNYTGSSQEMETAGATKLFGLSKEKHGLYYNSFCEDSDNKPYPAVKDIYDQLNLLRSLNVSVTIKNMSIRGFVI